MKTKIMIAMMVLAVVVPFVSADSYQLYCIPSGEVLNLPVLCNPAMEQKTGPINICMHILDNGKKCPASLNTCNNLGLGCSSSTDTEEDETPPTMQINSPVNGEVYTARSILLNLDPSEISDVDYIDNDLPAEGWRTLCQRCSEYSKSRNFKEGENNITFRVIDESGNSAFFDIVFYIDSKVPKIKKTEPKSGTFANGQFKVSFQEQNVKEVVLNYGNSDEGYREETVDVDTCPGNNDNYDCTVNVNLEDYDGQDIDYYFSVEDVAGSIVTSKPVFLKTDFSSPEFLNLDYSVNGKFVMFELEIDEAYFKSVTYKELNSGDNKEKTLCNKLTGNMCSKKVSFKDGEHGILVTARDLAGNSADEFVIFFTDSKKPKIKNVEPEKGFISSFFEVEFEEQNPVNLTLTYGNFDEGMKEVSLNLETDCFVNGGTNYRCSKDIDLTDYEDQGIEFYFTVIDRAEQIVNSKLINVVVDTLIPELGSANYTFVDKGKSALVKFSIDDANFYQANYVNLLDPAQKMNKLCSKLVNGECSGKVKLYPGENFLDIMVEDKAGNVAGFPLMIEPGN